MACVALRHKSIAAAATILKNPYRNYKRDHRRQYCYSSCSPSSNADSTGIDKVAGRLYKQGPSDESAPLLSPPRPM